VLTVLTSAAALGALLLLLLLPVRQLALLAALTLGTHLMLVFGTSTVVLMGLGIPAHAIDG
jgi:hypothetical protein